MDHGKTGDGEEMCQKNVEKTMKISKYDDFSKMIPDQLQSIFESKNQDFKARIDDFQIKNSRLRASVGGALGERVVMQGLRP